MLFKRSLFRISLDKSVRPKSSDKWPSRFSYDQFMVSYKRNWSFFTINYNDGEYSDENLVDLVRGVATAFLRSKRNTSNTSGSHFYSQSYTESEALEYLTKVLLSKQEEISRMVQHVEYLRKEGYL